MLTVEELDRLYPEFLLLEEPSRELDCLDDLIEHYGDSISVFLGWIKCLIEMKEGTSYNDHEIYGPLFDDGNVVIQFSLDMCYSEGKWGTFYVLFSEGMEVCVVSSVDRSCTLEYMRKVYALDASCPFNIYKGRS